MTAAMTAKGHPLPIPDIQERPEFLERADFGSTSERCQRLTLPLTISLWEKLTDL